MPPRTSKRQESVVADEKGICKSRFFSEGTANTLSLTLIHTRALIMSKRIQLGQRNQLPVRGRERVFHHV